MIRTHAITVATAPGHTMYRGTPASAYRRVEARTSPRVTRPNYAARRLGALFVAVAATVALSGLLGALLEGFGGSPAAAAGTPSAATLSAAALPTPAVRVEAVPVAVQVARAGDSLWSIADENRGDVDRDRYVDQLIALNGGTTVDVGQAVVLP